MKGYSMKKSFLSFGVLLATLSSSLVWAQTRIDRKLVCIDDRRTMSGIEVTPIIGEPNYFRFIKFELKEVSGGKLAKGKIIYRRQLGYDVDRSTAQYSYFDRNNEIILQIFKMETDEGTHTVELTDLTEDRWNGNQTNYEVCNLK
jgi:hypothetical protein